MGHAQRKVESVHSRTVLPPALPMRSGIAPRAARPSAPAPRTLPPQPPLAALNSARAPKSPLPAADLELAILPQWADANAPLLPGKKSRFGLGFWIGSTTVSLVAGALVAAGLMGARLPERTTQPEQHVVQETVKEQAPLQLAAAEPDMEIGTEEVIAHEQIATAPPTVLVPEVTVTAAKAVQPVTKSKRGKVTARAKAKASSASRGRGRGPNAASVLATTWQSAQPEPANETEEPSASEATVSTQAAVEAAPAPEPVAAPEPPKPVLPEQLTREQVRQGMESKRNAVITCAKGAYGKVLADITIAQSGKVSSSVIEGTFAGTSVGSCMSGALRGVQFPAFSGPEIQVRYPFSF